MLKKFLGQTFIDYTLMVGVLIACVMGMQVLISRGSRSMIKTMADQIGNQEWSEQDFNDAFIQTQKERTYSRTDSETFENEEGIRYTFNDSSDYGKTLIYNMENL